MAPWGGVTERSGAPARRRPGLPPKPSAGARIAAIAAIPALALVTALASPASASVAPKLAVGGYHGCALFGTGRIQCWGSNDFGQLGDGTLEARTGPVTVTGLPGTPSIVAAGTSHTCAVVASGTAKSIRCWGDNEQGQLGAGTNESYSTAPVAVAGISGNPVALAAGDSHTCAILSSGATSSIKCWGGNDYGQLGNGSTTSSISPATVKGITGTPVALTAGQTHTCAIILNGTTRSARCWGNNDYGQLGTGTTAGATSAVAVKGLTGSALAIGAGELHTCVLLASGAVRSVRCWGDNQYGQLGNGTATESRSPVAVKSLPTTVDLLTVGARHGCASTSTVTTQATRCWGGNAFGQLGDGSTVDATSAVVVSQVPATPSQIGAGAGHTCAVTGSSVNCWGINDAGQLGRPSGSKCTVDGFDLACSLAPLEVQVDEGPPAAPVITTSPAGTVTSRSARIAFSTPAGTTAVCSIDAGEWTGCQSPIELSALADGTHTMAIRSRSEGGRESEGSIATWTVDTTPPALTRPPVTTRSGTSIVIDTAVTEGSESPARLEWSNAGSKPSDSTTPVIARSFAWKSRLTVANQTAVAWVRVADQAGNWGPWLASVVPLAPPKLSGAPNQFTASTQASIAFTGAGGRSFECSVDGGEPTTCTSPLELTGLGDGQHSLTIAEIDGFGIRGVDARATWTVDTVPPEAPVVATKTPQFTNSRSAAFTFTKPSAGVTITCSTDGRAAAPCASGALALKDLRDGPHILSVSAVDGAGNAATTSFAWTVDLKPPVLASKSRSKVDGGYSFVLNAQDASPITSIEWTTARSAPKASAKPVASRTLPFSSPIVVPATSAPTWLRLADSAGNWSRWYAG